MLQEIEKFECGTCGSIFTTAGVYFQDGAYICLECYRERAAVYEAERAATASAYAQAATSQADARLRSIPSYANIEKGAGLLKAQANLVNAFGWVAIVIGVLLALVTIFEGLRREEPTFAVGGAVIILAGAIGTAIGFFNWATMIRMLAELALAQRDIARNSFRQ